MPVEPVRGIHEVRSLYPARNHERSDGSPRPAP